MRPPIFIITGPPASGKSTVSRALLQHFEFGVHIPVDELREFVVSGISHPIGWTSETTRQFRLAETSACLMSKVYNDGEFAVAIDHCETISVLNAMADVHLADQDLVKVVLQPKLDENLLRNYARGNKDFDSEVLVDTIRRLNPMYCADAAEFAGWHRIDNTEMTILETASRILEVSGTDWTS